MNHHLQGYYSTEKNCYSSQDRMEAVADLHVLMSQLATSEIKASVLKQIEATEMVFFYLHTHLILIGGCSICCYHF